MRALVTRSCLLAVCSIVLVGGVRALAQEQKPLPSPVPSPRPIPQQKPDANQEKPDPNSKARISWEEGSNARAFGKACQGDVLKHTFQLKSTGEADLIIRQAKPSCGCTMAQLLCEQADGQMAAYVPGTPIPPGRRIEIGATLNTQHKHGAVTTQIFVLSNDPRGQISLGLSAEVEPYFVLTPPLIQFSSISTKSQVTDKVVVRTSKGERMRILPLREQPAPNMRIEFKPIDPDAEGRAIQHEVVVTLGPGLREGPFAASIPLRSDLAIPGGERLPNGQIQSYETMVSVMATVIGAVSCDTSVLALGLIRPSQTLSRKIRIESHDPAFAFSNLPVELLGSDAATAWDLAQYFTITQRPLEGQHAVELELTLKGMPQTLNGAFSGTLLVKVGHPEKQELRLAINGMCRPASGGPAPLPNPAPPQVPPK